MTGERYFICIDAGTTRFKTACITPGGDIIAKSDYRYRSNKNGTHEYSKSDFKEALKKTLGEMLSRLDAKKVSAVGVTGHGPTLIPVGEDGIMLSSGIGYLDDRVKRYIKKLAERKEDHVTSTMYIPIACFFKDELPRVYEKTFKFLQSFDYLAFLLTGEFTASSSSSGIKPWEKEKVLHAGLDIEKFPEILYLGSCIGKVSRSAALEYGIPVSTPLYAIGVDFAAALIGTGAIERGRSCERAGTSGGLNLCWDKRVSDRRLLCYTHFIPDRWNVAGITSSSGISVEWMAKLLRVDYEKFRGFQSRDFSSRGGKKNTPGSIIFLPYLRGERTPLWNPYARGVFFGLEESHTADDLLKSVFTGVALSIRDVAEIIEENGCRFTSPIVTTGGGAKNRWFIQLKSDVTGKPFCVTQTHDAELIGIACILAQQEGHCSDLRQAVKKIVKTDEVFEPDAERHEAYTELYSTYRDLRRELSRFF
ncbi:MAG TPA: FGGY-family carbohydrate kinase [Spirochaetota bacterium]|nr:FGGY-family carbohydrate kinase [Spirochaetota bacterium]